MIAEKVSRFRRLRAHDSTLFVNVLAIGGNAQRRIDQHRVNLIGSSAWSKIKREIAVGIDAS